MEWFEKVRSENKKMNFFNYPVEIWFASFVAVMFKLKMTSKFTVIGTITTVSIAMFSGLIMYTPLVDLLQLSPSWNVPIAILVAITAENFMKNVVDISNDGQMFKDWLGFIVTRKMNIKPTDDENKPQ